MHKKIILKIGDLNGICNERYFWTNKKNRYT